MDLSMPFINGIEATKIIRQSNTSYKEIPILALTATTDKSKIDSFYTAGIVDYILKPYTKSTLVSTIAKQKASFEKQHKKNSRPEKIENLIEDFGPEYATKFIEQCESEANRLIEEMKDGYFSQHYKLVADSAHDLCSITGQIGMENTLNVCRSIENAAENKDKERLDALFFDFYYHLHNELQTIKK